MVGAVSVKMLKDVSLELVVLKVAPSVQWATFYLRESAKNAILCQAAKNVITRKNAPSVPARS
jgi:hypothetical protein